MIPVCMSHSTKQCGRPLSQGCDRQALNQPIPEHIDEPLPSGWAQYMSHFRMLTQQLSVCNIKTFLVEIDARAILVEIEKPVR